MAASQYDLQHRQEYSCGALRFPETSASDRCFMQRRSFLKGTRAVIVAVAGGGVWRAYEQGVFSVGERPAYEPWKH